MKKLVTLISAFGIVTGGALSVVGCQNQTQGSSTQDQKAVDDTYYAINNLKLGVSENTSGNKKFSVYKQAVINQLQAKLPTSLKNLISISSQYDNLVLPDTKFQSKFNIQVNIQKHKIKRVAQIYVRLNYDATTITDKIDNLLIDVQQNTPAFQTSEPLSKYQVNIKNQINTKLTSAEQSSGYQLTFTNLASQTIAWPTNEAWTPQAYAFTLLIGSDSATGNVKIEFLYSQQYKVLDDPTYGSQTYPIHIYMGSAGDEIPPSQWKADQITSDLNEGWEGYGGLIPALEQYVTYKPVTIIKNKLVLSEMYLAIFGFTKENPRPFYIMGY